MIHTTDTHTVVIQTVVAGKVVTHKMTATPLDIKISGRFSLVTR
jgi:hypothetical protein